MFYILGQVLWRIYKIKHIISILFQSNSLFKALQTQYDSDDDDDDDDEADDDYNINNM